jgi:hypothetical protein
MKVSKRIRILLLICLVALGGLELAELLSVRGLHGFVSFVNAEVGRPRSPVSVAGVARRTARRN